MSNVTSIKSDNQPVYEVEYNGSFYSYKLGRAGGYWMKSVGKNKNMVVPIAEWKFFTALAIERGANPDIFNKSKPKKKSSTSRGAKRAPRGYETVAKIF